VVEGDVNGACLPKVKTRKAGSGNGMGSLWEGWGGVAQRSQGKCSRLREGRQAERKGRGRGSVKEEKVTAEAA